MAVSDKQPVFLERKGYRQRRLMDALRLLPVLGAMLWMLPLFWPDAAEVEETLVVPVRLSSAVLYIFAVWLGLILAAAALGRVLSPTLSRDTSDDRSE